MSPWLDYERNFLGQGHRLVAGLDEVGRGALAGPVVVGAVILPIQDTAICSILRAAGLRDSKQLTSAQRATLAALLPQIALGVAVGAASAEEIDNMGIVAATQCAMRRALTGLPIAPTALLLDAFALPNDPRPQQAIIKGDTLSLSIAAAAVYAKVHRDALMCQYDRDYPAYGFAHHKGYGAPQHLRAIADYGPSPLHRRTWKPFVQPSLF